MQSDKQKIQNGSCSSSEHENSCLNCHFLMKWDRGPNGSEWKFEIAHDERTRLACGKAPEEVLGGDDSLGCYQNVWDWANRCKDSENDLVRVLTHDRGETCFFYSHTPGMLFPAAAELERRKVARREARQDRKVAKLGIVIAAFAALGGAAVGALLAKVFG
ncbi:MAG: hypothetical protein KAV82_09115 [Phycisphaerae bacterium]|nr:hypothetical protein [Phycisphaerae bacterium]